MMSWEVEVGGFNQTCDVVLLSCKYKIILKFDTFKSSHLPSVLVCDEAEFLILTRFMINFFYYY